VKRHIAVLLLSLLFLNLASPASGVQCARASTGEAGATRAADHVAHRGHQTESAARTAQTVASAHEAPIDHQQLPAHCSAVMACLMFALPDLGMELVAVTPATGRGNWAPPGILSSIRTAPELPPPRA
jgi:hypothetical protein